MSDNAGVLLVYRSTAPTIDSMVLVKFMPTGGRNRWWLCLGFGPWSRLCLRVSSFWLGLVVSIPLNGWSVHYLVTHYAVLVGSNGSPSIDLSLVDTVKCGTLNFGEVNKHLISAFYALFSVFRNILPDSSHNMKLSLQLPLHLLAVKCTAYIRPRIAANQTLPDPTLYVWRYV